MATTFAIDGALEKDYTLSDGSVVSGPSNPNADEKAWLRSKGGLPPQSAGMDMFKAGMSGLGEGALRAPFIGGDLFGLGATLLEKVMPGSTTEQNRRSQSQEVIDTLGVPLYKPETTGGRYANSIGNAVGGGLVLPIGGVGSALNTGVNVGRASGAGAAITSTMARAAQTPVLQNAAIGAGAQLGGEISSKGATQEENPLMRLAGGAGTALLAALAGRISTPKFAGSTSRALEDMKPADWQTAAKMNADMTAAGATKQTVADLLPETSRLRAVAQEMSNERGAGVLRDKLAGRDNGEIATLLNDSKTLAQGAAVSNMSVLPGTAGADQFIADVARGNRTGAMMPHLVGADPVPQSVLKDIAQALRQRGKQRNNFGSEDGDFSRNAAATINNVPTYPIKPLPTPPMSGPGVLTGGPASPVAPPTGMGLPGPGQAPVNAPQIAQNPGTGLSVPGAGGPLTSPGMPPIANVQGGSFGPGSGFKFPNNQPITDVNIPLPREANLEALSKIVKSLQMVGAKADGPAGEVLKNSAALGAAGVTSRELAARNPAYAAAMRAYGDMSPQVELTQLLAKNKLHAIPSRAHSGLPADQVREELISALTKIDPVKAEMFTGKLKAADQLSMLKPQQGAEGIQQELKQTAVGSAVQPLGTIARKAGMASQLSSNKELARLIADPTPANMKILEQLGRNDPDVLRRLREIGNLGALNSATRVEQ